MFYIHRLSTKANVLNKYIFYGTVHNDESVFVSGCSCPFYPLVLVVFLGTTAFFSTHTGQEISVKNSNVLFSGEIAQASSLPDRQKQEQVCSYNHFSHILLLGF